jgi:RND family efflux transporter MFP subunit
MINASKSALFAGWTLSGWGARLTPRLALSLSLTLSLTLLAGCSAESAQKPAPTPVPAVRIAVVQSANIIPQIQGIGTAAWRRETPLGFTTGGQIARVFVNEGDRVQRGQLLAVLSTTPVEAELTAALAESQRASSDADRLRGLYKKGWVTKPRYETAQASAQASAAQVRARRFALETAKVIAPSGGVVLARLAEPTQVVAAGTPVIIVGEAAGGYVIRVPVNDRAAAALTIGAPAIIRFEALGGPPLQGSIVEIGGKARQTTGTFDVEIALPNAAGLRSGMIGMVSMIAGRRDATPRVLVPAGALISPRAGEALVYVIDDSNTARLRKVNLGEATDNGIEILAGLTGGERIALTGFDKIKEGSRVNPVTRAL